MPKSDLLLVKKFAKLLEIPDSTIRHYDRIGLLPSAVRGENAYRYFSIRQAASINVIRILKEFNIPLKEIKEIMKKRSPEFMSNLLKRCSVEIDSDIVRLCMIKKLLSDLQGIINPVLNIDHDIIYIKEIDDTRIILGEVNKYNDNTDEFDAMFNFYEYIHEKYPNICFYYPVWAIFSQERIKNKDWKWPDRYYVYCDIGEFIRKKSLYAIGYTKSWYGNGGELYEKMLLYIEDNGFEICGDVYEEYPLNELCNVNEEEYLMRLLIPVRKKPFSIGSG